MTTLNTIIEEEKTKAKEYLDSAINNREKALDLDDVLDTVITAAIQRVYEAGRISWLRSEIEMLEGVKDYSHMCESSEGIECEFTQAITTIITRYKEELKELESK